LIEKHKEIIPLFMDSKSLILNTFGTNSNLNKNVF